MEFFKCSCNQGNCLKMTQFSQKKIVSSIVCQTSSNVPSHSWIRKAFFKFLSASPFAPFVQFYSNLLPAIFTPKSLRVFAGFWLKHELHVIILPLPSWLLPSNFFISFTNVIKREKTINENQNHRIEREREWECNRIACQYPIQSGILKAAEVKSRQKKGKGKI